LIIPEYTKPHA